MLKPWVQAGQFSTINLIIGRILFLTYKGVLDFKKIKKIAVKVRKTMLREGISVCSLYKEHKGKKGGNPPTRPVAGAISE